MLSCPYCGGTVSEGQNFCPFCRGDLRQNPPDVAEPETAGAGAAEPPSGPAGESQPSGEVPADAAPAPDASAAVAAGADSKEPSPKKTPSRRIIAAAIAAVVVVAAGAGGFAFYQHQRGVTYEESLTLLERGEYAAALEGFSGIGDYEDAAEQAEFCRNSIGYEEAEDLLASGDYAAAREAFAALGSFSDASEQVDVCDAWEAFEEASALTDKGLYEEAAAKAAGFSSVASVRNAARVVEWRNDNSYHLAEGKLAAGSFYDAYSTFTGLGDYRDAADRATECIQPNPATGELFHNGSYVSNSIDVVFDAARATRSIYLRVYNGDDLVSNVFINAGGSATIHVPAGTYTFKKAQGDLWFGEADLFGDDGSYTVLLFDDNSESVGLEDNKIYTITFAYSGAGNVGDRSVGADSF